MRTVVLTLAMMLASGSAMAGSIEHIRGNKTSNDSVISITCQTCPAPVRASVEAASPALQPGTQNIAVREVSGRKETVRTEAWLGGSPVTYVSANPVWLPSAEAITALAAQAPAPVDTATVTSALDTTRGVSPLDSLAQTPLRQAQ